MKTLLNIITAFLVLILITLVLAGIGVGIYFTKTLQWQESSIVWSINTIILLIIILILEGENLIHKIRKILNIKNI